MLFNMRFIKKIQRHILNIYILGYLKFNCRLKAGNRIKFYKIPVFRLHKKSTICIGSNVVFNSKNDGYHLNMHSKCKLMADKPEAIITIGDNTRIHGSCIHAYKKISIGKNCLIAANCQIFDGNGHDLSFGDVDNRINTKGDSKDVIIEDSVWLGTNVVVLPGVHIGKGSIISANSVVHKDVPAMVIAGGNPLQILKRY